MQLAPQWPLILGLATLFTLMFAAPVLVLTSTGITRRRQYRTLENEEHAGVEELEERKRSISSTSFWATLLSILTSVLIITAVLLRYQRDGAPDVICKSKSFNIKGRHVESWDQFSLPASRSRASQNLFNAAIVHAFGYDHVDAQALFERAWLEDKSNCSLCIWGQAYSMGPFINRAIFDSQEPPGFPAFSCEDSRNAYAVAAQAERLSRTEGGSELAGDLTRALAERFAPQSHCTNAALMAAEDAYASRMAIIARKHKDATIAALAAEARMNLFGIWNFTLGQESSTLRDGAKEALELVEYALSITPSHVFALHLKIHLLETMPLSSSGQALLSDAERAADNLAALQAKYYLPGHLLHMPSHLYARIGRWSDAMEVSNRAVQKDQVDSQACGNPYAPEHNLDMAVMAGVLGGDYSSAMRAVSKLIHSQQLFRQTYVSPGTNLAAAIEVRYLGGKLTSGLQCEGGVESVEKCNDLREVPHVNARGRYSRGGKQFVAGLSIFSKILCTVHKDIQGEHLGNLVQLESHMQELKATVQKMPPDYQSIPGPGLGLYSAGYKTILQAYVHVSESAIASLHGAWETAVNSLEKAVQLEHSMGHFEPARLFPLRPCLISVLIMSNQIDKAQDVYDADVTEYPHSWWSIQSLKTIQMGKEGKSNNLVKPSCALIFGE